MPELPEVESWRRLTEDHVLDSPIRSVYAAQDTIVFEGVAPRSFARKLTGRVVRAAHRKGKQLWWELDRRPWPAFHFGMTGSFRLFSPQDGRPPYTKAAFEFESGACLAMINKRRLGRIRLQQDPPTEPPVVHLGRDPFLDPISAPDMAAMLEKRKAPIKAALLNQALFAGVGNWIADEVLYQAGVSPQRRCTTLSHREIRSLSAKLRSVVRMAVKRGAYSGNFPRSWLFHRRWDWKERMARGERLRVDTVGGRTSVWDPAKQK